MELAPRLDLAGDNLLACLCPERNWLPYWHMVVDAERRAEYQFRPHCNGHNVGRWWNTMLRLERSTGYAIPPQIEAAMLDHTWRMCDNPCGILLDDPDPEQVHTWYLHSYRETMLALGLLVETRKSERAHRQGLRAIDCMRRATADLERWDLCRCEGGPPGLTYTGRRSEGPYTHGRAIEGLICFYLATGAEEAFTEARRLADFHAAHTLTPDGSLAGGCGHHTHSYLNTVRGLALVARLDGDQALLECIRSTYRRAIAAMLTPSGFVTHDIGAHAGGDIASIGDIAHIALLLWDYYGDPALLDEAERLVRCRLVPAQVVSPMPVEPMRDGGRDSLTDLPNRFVGAIGGSVGQVRGQTCVTDFTAAALHSLLELHDRAVDVGADAIRVNFHFDTDRAEISVRSRRRGSEARVRIDNRSGKELRLRLPGWSPAPAEVQLDGVPSKVHVERSWVLAPGSARKVELRFALPATMTEEPVREEDRRPGTLRFHWRGDEIVDIEPCGDYLAPLPAPNGSFL